jgi:hypothetical protein
MIDHSVDGNDARARSSPVGALVAAPIGPLSAPGLAFPTGSRRERAPVPGRKPTMSRAVGGEYSFFDSGEASRRSFQSVSITHAGGDSAIFGHPPEEKPQ